MAQRDQFVKIFELCICLFCRYLYLFVTIGSVPHPVMSRPLTTPSSAARPSHFRGYQLQKPLENIACPYFSFFPRHFSWQSTFHQEKHLLSGERPSLQCFTTNIKDEKKQKYFPPRVKNTITWMSYIAFPQFLDDIVFRQYQGNINYIFRIYFW